MSKKNTESGCAARAAGYVDRSAEPGRGDLEALRPVVRPQRDRLTVGDERAHRQRQRRLHHLGQPGGDIVKASGVDRDVVAGAVNLHPRAVQLRFENRCAAVAFERIGHAGRGLRQHRADRPAHPQGERLQRRRSTGQAGRRDRRQIPAQHRGALHRGGRDACGLGDGVGHDPGQRALAQFAAEQAQQKGLLGFGRRERTARDTSSARRA